MLCLMTFSKKIEITFGMKGDPYVLSDLTHASNRILLEMEWKKGKLRKERIAVPVNVGRRDS